MTLPAPSTAAAAVDRSTPRWGGIGFLVAGALQLLAVVRVVLPAAPEWITPGWQLLGWLLGGLVLLGASVLLAVGRRGAMGVVGRGRRRRAALIVSGSGDLLLVVVVLVALAGGPTVQAWSGPALAVAQLVVCTATVMAALAVRVAGVLTGPARWAFAALAVVDGVGAVLLPIPGMMLVGLLVVVVARPLVVLLTGVALLRRPSGAPPVEHAPSDERAPTSGA